jgi:hypothetical protein
MKKTIFWAIMFSMALGLVLTGCGDSNGGPLGNGGDQTGGNGGNDGTGSGGGKTTITLLAGSGTGNIRLKLSEGTWNTSGPWAATQSSGLNAIINSLLTTYGSDVIAGSQCTATIIENNTALNIELKHSSGRLVLNGSVYVKATLNPVVFPYTSHGSVSSLSEKFQVAGDPVTFLNKTRLYADISTPWANGRYKVTIRESQIEFVDESVSGFVYAYKIDTWSGSGSVTIDVSNGTRTQGSTPPSFLTDKTSFTFSFTGDTLYISGTPSGSGMNGWSGLTKE